MNTAFDLFVYKLFIYIYILFFFLSSYIKGQKVKKVKKKIVSFVITKSFVFLTFWGLISCNVKGQIIIGRAGEINPILYLSHSPSKRPDDLSIFFALFLKGEEMSL
jgi:hypothetical protein